MGHVRVTAIIECEGDGYVALCPELDVASQGDSIEAARKNLQEAVEGLIETADPLEIQNGKHSGTLITRLSYESQ